MGEKVPNQIVGIELPEQLDLRYSAYIAQRLQDERVIWLTTVSSDAMPQPRPVRFLWQNGAFSVFSAPTAYKLKHIARNPQVALHFDGGATGEDVAVFLSEAYVQTYPFPQNVVDSYLSKYADDLTQRGFSIEKYIKPDYVLLKIIPIKFRGSV